MMYTLSNFYQGRAWRNFMRVLRLERVNEEGLVICGYCGEPIIKEYDCIGHHIEELNEMNVNDATVALNPENVMLVHHKCHNRIHKKFVLGEDVRQVFLVYGAPCSGKTSWVNDVKCEGDLIIDIDSIWECISGCDRYVKPGRLNACAFAVRDTLFEMVRYRTGKWKNAYIIGGYPLISERERLLQSLGAREVFIDMSKEECLERLMNADDGRDVSIWSGYISDWFNKYHPPTLNN